MSEWIPLYLLRRGRSLPPGSEVDGKGLCVTRRFLLLVILPTVTILLISAIIGIAFYLAGIGGFTSAVPVQFKTHDKLVEKETVSPHFVTDVQKLPKPPMEFFEACLRGDSNLTRSLLISGQVKVNVKYNSEIHGEIGDNTWPARFKRINGMTCLMFATSAGQVEMSRMLIRQFGADVNNQIYGWTALHYAVRDESLPIVEVLCEEGKADLELKATTSDIGNGWTALMIAAYNDDYDIVDYLLRRGAKVNERNSNGKTAFDVARDEIVKERLRKFGAIE